MEPEKPWKRRFLLETILFQVNHLSFRGVYLLFHPHTLLPAHIFDPPKMLGLIGCRCQPGARRSSRSHPAACGGQERSIRCRASLDRCRGQCSFGGIALMGRFPVGNFGCLSCVEVVFFNIVKCCKIHEKWVASVHCFSAR